MGRNKTETVTDEQKYETLIKSTVMPKVKWAMFVFNHYNKCHLYVWVLL